MNQDRELIEKRIVSETIATLLNAGFLISVNDGEETPVTRSKDAAAIFAATMTTDEDYLIAYNSKQDLSPGWVRFVYGNGVDVLCDYSVSLEDVLTPINALTARIDEISYAGVLEAELTEARSRITKLEATGRSAADEARAIDDALNDQANDGANAQSPDGDSYNQLWSAIGNLLKLFPRKEA